MTAVAANKDHRNPVIAAATAGAMVGNLVKGVAIDRTRALIALPQTRAKGLTRKMLLQMPCGRFTSDVAPITGGTINAKLLGKEIHLTNTWGHAFRASNILGGALIGASMVYGIPNLADALKGGHAGSLVNTKEGRTGVFGLVANVAGGAALVTAWNKSDPGHGRVLRTLGHEVLADGKAVSILSILSIPVVANELGAFNFLNREQS